jgi:hypothetical protein
MAIMMNSYLYLLLRRTTGGAQAEPVWHCVEADLVLPTYTHLK